VTSYSDTFADVNHILTQVIPFTEKTDARTVEEQRGKNGAIERPANHEINRMTRKA
jgi:hypothetical protein